MSTVSSTTENYYVSSADETEDTSSGSDLTNGDFLALLITELTNQDPLDPMSNTEMVQQIASLEALEQQQAQTELLTTMSENLSSLNDTVNSLSDSYASKDSGSSYSNLLQTASSLVGMYVYGTDKTGDSVEGMVLSATLEDGDITLLLHNGDSIPYENITNVTMAVSDDESSE